MVDQAIIEAIAEDAPVSLRGVFYRVVSAAAVDKTDNGYELIGRELLKLRRSGAVPYRSISDGTRWIRQPTSWTGVDQMLEDAAASYRHALWHNQDADVHVFTEKDAISGVIYPITEKWDVPLGVLRGYASESFCWSVAGSIEASGKSETFIYQLGDHDPSGVDAWRAFRESVLRFLPNVISNGPDPSDPHALTYTFGDYDEVGSFWQRRITFKRLAVTEQQITDWSLPTRPTKSKDTRARSFAGGSVDVDAIRAPVLRQLLDDAITRHIDPDALRVTQEAEQAERELLTRMAGGTQ